MGFQQGDWKTYRVVEGLEVLAVRLKEDQVLTDKSGTPIATFPKGSLLWRGHDEKLYCCAEDVFNYIFTKTQKEQIK
ncbi:hypothetical protein KAR91_24595 [Candidatus Pacearchaeota archaeon]|nr:hypothetical protein [Candidatus Pacearchaeota archaeon]